VSVSTRSLVGALRHIVGPAGFSYDPKVLKAAAIDGRHPRWVVRPRTVEQLSAVLALAEAESLAVVPRGSGSSLNFGWPPARLDMVLDMTGFDRVVDDNPADLTVSLEAGVTLGALAARAATRQQFLPIDPPGAAARTLGGMVASNASGPLRFRYGTLRDLLLGVRFVQADGVVTRGGARVVKSVSGYDVPKLLVGSLGTLGVLVELTLRLHPAPAVERSWLLTLNAPSEVQPVVDGVLDSTLQPSRLEYLNPGGLMACALSAGGAALVVAIGSVEEAVREQGERLAELGRAIGVALTPLPTAFWASYDQAVGQAEGEVVLHLRTLPARFGETVQELEEELAVAAADLPPIVTGCAGLGTLRVVLTGAQAVDVRALVDRLRGFLSPMGGSVVVQGGGAELRRQVDPWGVPEPGVLALMRKVKATFDPKRVLSPGRFIGQL
jgi:glycolate oxidase FAD binding subunit